MATASLTEDIATSLRLHRNGWCTTYHNEVLACGLAARNMAEYQAQRLRWGTGAMELLRRERPLTGPALSLPQRLSYAATLLGWFDAWRTLGYVVLPIVALITGRLPIRSDATTFAIAFTTTFILQRIAMAVLARGFAPQGIAAVFEMIRLPVTLQATLTFLSIRDRAFVVTPKGRAERTTSIVPRLLIGLIAASVAALGVFAATLLGWTSVHYEQQGAAIGTALFASANCLVLVVAVARIRSERFAGDRRRGERFHVKAAGRVGSRPAEIVDVSVSGALVSTTVPAGEEDHVVLTLDFGTETIMLECVERSRRAVSPAGTFVVGLEFVVGQPEEIATLARRLFGAGSGVSRWAGISAAA